MRPVHFTPALIGAAALISILTNIAPLHAGTVQTYIVLYNHPAVPSDAADLIARSGGELVYSYPEIGVVIARSDDLSFHSKLRARSAGLFGAAATDGLGVHVNDDAARGAGESPVKVTANSATAGSDNLSALQWNMNQIHVPEARALSGGSASVIVGHIDTGIDYAHPDLAMNVDFTNSVSCLSGAPEPSPSAWLDDNGHGTHTAGLIAAANNGLGIIGVAPNTRIAAIKAGNREGLFMPEAAICAFMWAGSHRFPVVNSSYVIDPELYNCRHNPRQQVIWEAERRAVRFAMEKGSLVVSAVGNYSENVARPGKEVTGPDDPTPAARRRQLDCTVVPAAIPGVLGVSANGSRQMKAFYSSYGLGVAQVIAPGGDSVMQRTPLAPNGRVLSTWPSALAEACLRQVSDCSVSPCALYCYVQGTSMASAHVAGVAALLFADGASQSSAVASAIQEKADRQTCVDAIVYRAFPAVNSRAPQTCQGDETRNSFSGFGQVNALRSVAR
jgi:subtilisin family serine protease